MLPKPLRFFLLLLIWSSSSYSQQTVGLFLNDSLAYNGYTLFSPSSSTSTYLIDNCGRLINTWTSMFRPGSSLYLLENGHLLRTARIGGVFNAGGSGGRLELIDWNDSLLWSFNYASQDYHQHHDIAPLPNGNILILAWELHSMNEGIAAGLDPAIANPDGVWSEQIIEIKPIGTDSADIVWEWHLWDHLIQEFDSTRENFGVVANHPELLNINFGGFRTGNGDWIHANSLDYHPGLDQILFSSRHLHEIYIIDHSTTTAEAASHQGGNSGKGGDILYRWGNPLAYQRGSDMDQTLFGQHDANWIQDSLVDGGSIMVFNNGLGRPEGAFSSVDVIQPPMDSLGNYTILANMAYGPDSAFWRYTEQPANDMYSARISGARRLPNGNTLVCEGTSGHFRELTYDQTLVWEYISPIRLGGPVSQGTNISQNDVFRVSRYGEEYPAFQGKDLTPGKPIELNPLMVDCTIYSAMDTTDQDTMSTVIRDRQLLIGMQMHPNPFQTYLEIKNPLNQPVDLRILDLQGRIVFHSQFQPGKTTIPTSDWPSSVYIAHITSENKSTTIKLLK